VTEPDFTPSAVEIREPGYLITATSTADGKVRIAVGPRGNPAESRWIILDHDRAREHAMDVLAAIDGEKPEGVPPSSY
jgi:hypothetical protein